MKRLTFLTLLFCAAIVTASDAQNQHPAYLHALSNLRAARWMIEHRSGNWKTTQDEVAAVQKINDAIGEIKKASIDDGKDLNDHPKAEEINDHQGRLVKALEYLRKSRSEIETNEDDNFANGLKKRAFVHIDEAIRLTEKARRG
jgi:hypothetical protein